MIDKLTDKQEKKLEVYRNKWLKIGLSTDRLTIERAVEIKNGLYKHVLKYNDNVQVFVMDSPMSAFLATIYLAILFKEDIKQVVAQVREQVWEQVRGQVRERVRGQVLGQVWGQVLEQVSGQVLRQVREQVSRQVLRQVREQVRGQNKDFFFPNLYGCLDAGYISFYDFIFSELGIENPVKEAYGAFKSTLETGCIYAMKKFCVISQKPTKINMVNGKLHSNGSPAWEYADGVKGWALNGVAVPQYLAETPEGDLDIEWYLTQKNADVKAEFVRKYGVERMLSFGEKVDEYTKYNDEWWTKSEYALWNMGKLFDTDYQPYLKMRNQTTGVWHMEAVHPDCRDLPEAIKFRFDGKQVKIINIK